MQYRIPGAQSRTLSILYRLSRVQPRIPAVQHRILGEQP